MTPILQSGWSLQPRNQKATETQEGSYKDTRKDPEVFVTGDASQDYSYASTVFYITMLRCEKPDSEKADGKKINAFKM